MTHFCYAGHTIGFAAIYLYRSIEFRPRFLFPCFECGVGGVMWQKPRCATLDHMEVWTSRCRWNRKFDPDFVEGAVYTRIGETIIHL
jgi:hypothetical protein